MLVDPRFLNRTASIILRRGERCLPGPWLLVVHMREFSWETFGEWVRTGIVWAVGAYTDPLFG